FLLYLPYVCAGMGIGTLVRRNWLLLIAGALLSPVALMVLMEYPRGYLFDWLWQVIQSAGPDDFKRILFQSAFALVQPVVALLLFGIVWRYALWNETGADGYRSDRSLTIVLMHKEFRLQKNNRLLTVGTLILSVFAI